MSKKKKYHWFCLSFFEGKPDSFAIGSCVQGYNHKKVSEEMITKARIAATVIDKAVLLSCSYLGHMTIVEMNGK